MTMLETALSYARAGLAVLPLQWIAQDGGCSCSRLKPCKPGKHPLNSDGVSGATTDLSQIRVWWTRYPLANIGIAGGTISGGLYWCDFDEEAERVFPAWKNTLPESLTALPLAVVQTGRGYRVAWRVSGGGELKTEKLARAEQTDAYPKGALLVESRGDGGYGIAPPSIHQNGKTFTLLSGDLCDLPVLSPEDHERLLRAVRTFHAYTEPDTFPPISRPAGAFAGLGGPVRKGIGSSPDVDWPELWRRLDLSALASLLGELEPRPMSAGYVECRCPSCGERRAFVYPSNGQQGVTIRCNRANNCAYEKTLLQWLTERHGSTAAAVRLMSEAAGMPLAQNSLTLQRRIVSSGLRHVPIQLTERDVAEPALSVVARSTVAEMEGMEEPCFGTEEEAPADTPTVDAPPLAILARSVPKPDGYRLNRGVWEGTGVELLTRGFCVSCRSFGVPLLTEGEHSRCALCEPADQRISGPLYCDTFCEPEATLLRISSRIDPGGLLCCPECRSRMRKILEKIQQQSDAAAMAATG